MQLISQVVIKNVILYDSWQHVCGFVEFKTSAGKTLVKIRHNLSDSLIMTIAAKQNHTFNVTNTSQSFEISGEMDLNSFVKVCLMQRDGQTSTVLANGAINVLKEVNESVPAEISKSSLRTVIDETEHLPLSRKTAQSDNQYENRAAREIDELLRQVCSISSDGRGNCDTCPYRDHFFGETLG